MKRKAILILNWDFSTFEFRITMLQLETYDHPVGEKSTVTIF